MFLKNIFITALNLIVKLENLALTANVTQGYNLMRTTHKGLLGKQVW